MTLPGNRLEKVVEAINMNVTDEEGMNRIPAEQDVPAVHTELSWKMIMYGPHQWQTGAQRKGIFDSNIDS
eukprot:12903143-Prorocentrum_lima.AAC.1